MSILSVEELFTGRTSGQDRTYRRTYARAFEVITSDQYVGAKTVRTAAGIPSIGNSYTNGLSGGDPLYEADAGAFVSEVSAECVSDGIVWKVTCNYSAYDANEFGSNPVNWKVRVQFGGERTERVVYFDRDGNAILNSAGDRFSDPITVDDHITTMTITRNELVSTFDLDLASLYSDTINDATWNGFTARKCKLGIISTSEEQYDSIADVWYYTVTYPIQVSRDVWRKELLDQGYNKLNAYGSTEPIMRKGQPLSDPALLDGAGNEISGYGASPVTLPYYVFDEADWSGLNIDLSLRLGL